MKKINYLKIILLFIVITILIKTLFFYRGIYFAPKKTVHNLSVSLIKPESKKFIDAFEKTEGYVLIDKSHGNNFEDDEIEALLSRINSRNNKIEFLENEDGLENKLRYVNSFVVILPTEDFNQNELSLTKDFLQKNRKLLLIADPDRQSNINSIANNFNIIFSEDYLYNLKENNGNFRFISLKDFNKNEITKKLNKIAFYTSCPIFPLDRGVAFTDKNTYASSSESQNGFTPVVFLSPILAVCDLTFLNQPFNSVADNNIFISNIADFLTKNDRKFSVADFPYFFKKNVAIVTTNLDLSSNAVNLKNILSNADINANIKRKLNTSVDSIVIELFDEFKATPLENLIVDKDSIRINDLLFNKKDSSLVYLSKENATILTILSDNKKVMEKTITMIETEDIRKNLIDDNLAVFRFEVKEEENKENEIK